MKNVWYKQINKHGTQMSVMIGRCSLESHHDIPCHHPANVWTEIISNTQTRTIATMIPQETRKVSRERKRINMLFIAVLKETPHTELIKTNDWNFGRIWWV